LGELKGKQLEPRYIAELCFNQGWKGAVELNEAVMVCLSESQGYTHAVNDNVKDDVVTSRDCGIFQINIPASQIGSSSEMKLYDPVENVRRAWLLYQDRKWQPWYGFTNEVYLRDTYLKRATRGVGNFMADMMLKRTPTDTLNEGQPYEHTLKTPILDYTYRVAALKYGLTISKIRAQQIKPMGGVAIDTICDQIIKAVNEALAIAKK
jgi:hypothetical protein